MAQPEFGATAWGRAWLRTVERMDGMPNPQLPKARSLARNQKASLTIGPDTITAAVADGNATHQVSIQVRRWDTVQAECAAPLLAGGRTASAVGDLPDDLADALTKAGAPVAVPLDEITASCTCRARARPCAHVLAALYGLVLVVDERPVTALELRADDLSSSHGADGSWIELTTIRPENFYTTA